MEAIRLFTDALQFSEHLYKLRQERRQRKMTVRARRPKRLRLTAMNRRKVLAKTGGRCHICGGRINSEWDADHVFAHAQGGSHSVDNYLPAHSICNSYRWFYGAEEFQWILKLGVWLRTRIELKDDSVMQLAERFVRHETRRDSRRKVSGSN